MSSLKILRESLLLIILIIQTLSSETEGSPIFSDIRSGKESEFKELKISEGSVSFIEQQDTVVTWEILVEPYRRVIYSGEQTTITIDLHGFDTAGQKIQAFRPDVLVEINGIIDGTAVPGSGKIILDQLGIGWIDDLSTTFTPGPVEYAVSDPTITGIAESLRTYLKNLGTPLPADIEIPEDEEKAEVQLICLLNTVTESHSSVEKGKR